MATLEECVAEFLQSKEVRDYIKASLNKKDVVIDDKSGALNQFAKARATAIAEELADMLRDEIRGNEVISERAKTVFLGAIRTGAFFDDECDAWVAAVYFDRERVSRRSWLNNGSGDENQDPDYDFDIYIPVLFNSGYTAKNYVYTTINGKRIRSRIHRDPGHFLENTKDRFDKLHRKDGLFAIVNDNYEADREGWRTANDNMFNN